MQSTADFALIAHRQAQRTAWAVGIAALALVAICFVTIHAGAIPIPPGTATHLIAQQLGFAPVDDSMQALRTILIDIRLPRVALGILTGAGLAVAGVTLQGLFRNPLADPSLVGVSTGAATARRPLSSLAGRWRNLSAPLLRHALPVAAFAGALATTILIYAIATREGRTDVATLLLAGVAINAMAAACIGFADLPQLRERQLRDLNFWMLGSLNGVTWGRSDRGRSRSSWRPPSP